MAEGGEDDAEECTDATHKDTPGDHARNAKKHESEAKKKAAQAADERQTAEHGARAAFVLKASLERADKYQAEAATERCKAKWHSMAFDLGGADAANTWAEAWRKRNEPPEPPEPPRPKPGGCTGGPGRMPNPEDPGESARPFPPTPQEQADRRRRRDPLWMRIGQVPVVNPGDKVSPHGGPAQVQVGPRGVVVYGQPQPEGPSWLDDRRGRHGGTSLQAEIARRIDALINPGGDGQGPRGSSFGPWGPPPRAG